MKIVRGFLTVEGVGVSNPHVVQGSPIFQNLKIIFLKKGRDQKY